MEETEVIIDEVLQKILVYEGKSFKDIQNRCRKHEYSHIRLRYIFFKYLIECAKPFKERIPMADIGKAVGVNHTQVAYSFRVVINDYILMPCIRLKIEKTAVILGIDPNSIPDMIIIANEHLRKPIPMEFINRH